MKKFNPSAKWHFETPPNNFLLLLCTLLLNFYSQVVPAQTITSTSNVSFQSNDQSLFGPGPAVSIEKNIRFLEDNGVDASFFAQEDFEVQVCLDGNGVNTINTSIDLVNTAIDAANLLPDINLARIDRIDEACFGGNGTLKAGFDFDLFLDLKISSGDADVTYPIQAKFIYPESESFACGDEIKIQTSLTTQNGYALDLQEPILEATLGAEIRPGFSLSGQLCAIDCAPIPGALSYPSNFGSANASNYKSYLGGGDYSLLSVSTNSGIQLPWDYHSIIPSPSFLPSLALPIEDIAIDPFNITLNRIANPFANIDGPDVLSGDRILDNTSNEYFGLSFDPIQFQQFLTGVPLTFGTTLGPVAIDLTAFSAPINLDIEQFHSFEFDPSIKVDLDLGRVVSWKEMNGSTIINQGTSSTAVGFTLGNDLVITYPQDNLGSTISPTFKLNNTFKAKIEEEFKVSLDIIIAKGEVNFPSVNVETICNDLIAELNIPATNIPPVEIVTERCPCRDNIFDPPKPGEPLACVAGDTYPCAWRTVTNLQDLFVEACAGLNAAAESGNIEVKLLETSINFPPIPKLTVLDKTFSMGGFNMPAGLPFTLRPDYTAPVAVTKDITIDLVNGESINVNANQFITFITDNLSTNSEATGVVPSTFSCDDIGVNPVTITITDNNCNATTVSANLTITAPPQVTACQDITVDLNTFGTASITAAEVDNNSFDPCGIVSRTLNNVNFDCEDIGQSITTTLTVVNTKNVSSQCQANVTVRDITPPELECDDLTVILEQEGLAQINIAAINGSVIEACGIASFTLSQDVFTCIHVGDNNVTLNAIDIKGNVAESCLSTVTVIDLAQPSIDCKDITLSLPESGSTIIQSEDLVLTSSDNCGIDQIQAMQLDFDCTDLGTAPVQVDVNDINNNYNHCFSNVTVLDEINPTALCKDVTVHLDVDGNATITPSMVDNQSFDNCTITDRELNINNFDCTDVGEVTVTLSLKDQSNNEQNCTATVTVVDDLKPVITCGTAFVEVGDSGFKAMSPVLLLATLNEACDLQPFVASQTEFTCADLGENPIQLTVTDINGNIATCEGIVIVTDIFAPSPLCQNITIELEDDGTQQIQATDIDYGSTDTCSIVSYDLDQYDFDCVNIGIANPVNLMVTDQSGNQSSCIANVSVLDKVTPIAICQDITIQLDQEGAASIEDQDINNGSNDACGIESLTASTTAFGCADVGVNEVTLTVEDVNGNEATCTATVSVEDKVIPIALCKDITIALDGEGNQSIIGEEVDNNSTDACGIANYVVSLSSFDCVDLGENIVILTVADLNGNDNHCQATVTVIDNLAPVPDIAALPTPADCEVSLIAPTALDNCSGVITATTNDPIDYSVLGEYEVIWTYTDEDGNSSSQIQTVIVQDIIEPEVIAGTIPLEPMQLGNSIDATVLYVDDCDKEDHSATWDWGDGTTSTATIDQVSNAVADVHTYTETGVFVVKLTLSDGSGNTIEYVFETFAVIYDPLGGFVTGAGSIESPEGAYLPDPTLTGNARFGFFSKYQNGAQVPDGRSEFKFRAADLKFVSTSYEWLVITGSKAKFKGDGQINGAGNYGFMITATDSGNGNNADPDKFRIKIWDKDEDDAIVYDNKLGSSDNDYDAQAITTGAIRVVRGNGSNGMLANDEEVIVEESIRADESQVPTYLNTNLEILLAPNPFHNFTTISYTISVQDRVIIDMVDKSGTVVAQIVNEVQLPGEYQIEFTPKKQLSTGVYFIRCSTDNQVLVKKIIKID